MVYRPVAKIGVREHCAKALAIIWHPRHSASAERILVVDDEDLSRNNLCLFLRGEGYEVRDAATGPEALEILNRERFNLVFTDFIMPHVDGIWLVDLIHAQWPTIPVVLVTAYLSTGTGDMILAGKTEVISKPIDLSELLTTTRRLLH
jgi:CheY-like chemotaxis protein